MINKNLNQAQQVYKYMKEKGGISSFEAFENLGIVALSARINNLEKEGIRIKRRRIETKNRYGKHTHYTKCMTTQSLSNSVKYLVAIAIIFCFLQFS